MQTLVNALPPPPIPPIPHSHRLTQTLVNALGPPGPEGLFRAGLEAALLALRSRREVRGLTLIPSPSPEIAAPPPTNQRCFDTTTPLQGVAALLDAVLGDAGVEWSAEREDAAARQALELAVALQLFASRMEELRDQIRMQVGGDMSKQPTSATPSVTLNMGRLRYVIFLNVWILPECVD